ncbi:MAG: hypothetical protein JW963_17790, partial [Anaerolineales bacterium]|nr:hypothetical protein [Anaerolineales bacterium]
EVWRGVRERRLGRVLVGVAGVAVLSLVLILPALWQGVGAYLAPRLTPPTDYTDVIAPASMDYYQFSWRSIISLGTRPWLLILTAFSAIIGLIRTHKMAIASLLWAVILYLLGLTYLLGIPAINVTNTGAVLIMLYLPTGLMIGTATELFIRSIRSDWRDRLVRVGLALILVACFVSSHVRVTEIVPYRYFVTPEDVEGMRWIDANTSPDALFAVNTYFWLPNTPHGTDGGYWIPYFTDRDITVPPMIISLADRSYVARVLLASRSVEELEICNDALAELAAMGVDYIYIGQNGDFSGPGLNADQLERSEDVRLVYQNEGVFIFQLDLPAD